jgi:hypothetical protein
MMNSTNTGKSDDIKKEFPETLRRNLGNISATCEKLNIHRDTYYDWRAKDPEFDKACHDSLESLKDRAESVLYKKVLVDEETTSLIFFCKTKMKDRGYVERVESTGKDGNPVVISYTPLNVRNQELIDKVTNGE